MHIQEVYAVFSKRFWQALPVIYKQSLDAMAIHTVNRLGSLTKSSQLAVQDLLINTFASIRHMPILPTGPPLAAICIGKPNPSQSTSLCKSYQPFERRSAESTQVFTMQPPTKSTDIIGGPPHLQPAVSRRPHGANRFIVFSPKAKRRLDLFGIPQLHLWLHLEADPAATQLCERPVVIQDAKRPRTVDFWVAGPGLNKYLLIARVSSPAGPSAEPRFPAFRAWAKEVGCEVEEVKTPENSPDQETWYGNWTMILQQISNYGPFLKPKMTEHLRNVSTRRIAMSELLHQFPKEDPELVRATIFKLVHEGVLRLVDLRKDRLSDLSEVEPS